MPTHPKHREQQVIYSLRTKMDLSSNLWKISSDGTDSFGGTAPIATYYSRPALDLAPEDVFLTIEEQALISDEIGYHGC